MTPTTHEETLHPRKRKWALVFLGSAAFVAGGFFMVNQSNSSSERFWAYLCIVFFGLCVLVGLIQFIPGSSFLRLGPDGFTVRAMWRSTFYRWSDVEQFGVTRIPPANQPVVGFDFSTNYPRRDQARVIKRINRNLTGFEAALPDNYGWDCAELAAHLNQLREQYASSHAPTRPS
jgi:uncharacterized membrane protein